MKYYSAMKKNEILPFKATGMDLEGIMFGETNQTEKDKFCIISLIHGIWKTKQNHTKPRLINTENIMVAAGG